MSNVGVSVGLCNLWLNSLRNVPFYAPIMCVQLHNGFPGVDGTSNISTTTARQSGTWTAGTAAAFGLTATPPTWIIGGPDVLAFISVWSGFEGDANATYLWSSQLNTTVAVAEGDTYYQNSANLLFPVTAA